MLIRPICERDIPAVAAIEEACFSRPWQPVELLLFAAQPTAVFLMAEEAGQLLGYVGMRCVMDEGQIQNIAVAPFARRRGVATALLSALFAVGKGRDLAIYTLEVRASNLAAQALYERHGFVAVGRRRQYYTAPTEDAVLMTRTEE